jgi:ABC-type spermidine/putrescine transport system permease subunit I
VAENTAVLANPSGGSVSGRAILGLPVAYVAILFVLPIASLLIVAGGWQSYGRIVGQALYWDVLLNTFKLAALVTFFTLLIAYPIAFRARIAGRHLRIGIMVCATIPMWTSLLARSYAWISVLDRQGLVNSVLKGLHLIDRPLRLLHTSEATLVSSVYIMLPLMILTLYAQMSEIDLGMMRAARTLGARPTQVFVRVFLPLSMPGVVAGSLLTFIVSLGLFVTPALLGAPQDRTFSMLIEQQVNVFGDFSLAAALSIFLLLASIVVLWFFFRVTRAGLSGRGPGSGVTRRPKPIGAAMTRLLRRLSPVLPVFESRHSWNLFLALVLVFLFLPLFTLVPMSFGSGTYLQFPPKELSLRWYHALIDDPKWLTATGHSTLVAGLATALSLLVGLMASLGLRDLKSSSLHAAMVLFLAPSLIPPMVYALAAYSGAAALSLDDTVLGLALAHSILALPFVVVICSTGLREIGMDVDRAARSLGASWWRRLRRITLPLLGRSLIVSALVAFQTSFDEIVVALFLSGTHMRTLPKAFWQAAILEVTPVVPAAAVAVMLVGLLLAGLGVLIVLLTRPASRATRAGLATH